MPKKAPEKIGSVLRVPLSQLHPHPQNPFSEPVSDLLDFVDRLESLRPDEYHSDEVVIYET